MLAKQEKTGEIATINVKQAPIKKRAVSKLPVGARINRVNKTDKKPKQPVIEADSSIRKADDYVTQSLMGAAQPNYGRANRRSISSVPTTSFTPKIKKNNAYAGVGPKVSTTWGARPQAGTSNAELNQMIEQAQLASLNDFHAQQ